jgi:hypothetical protein
MTSTENPPVWQQLRARLRPPGSVTGRYAERLPLPSALDGADAVPLERALAAAQATLPTVTGLAAGGGQLTVTYREPPAEADRQRLYDLLADPQGLRATATPAESLAGGSLIDRLRDETTPDAEWLRLFRRWAVTGLLAAEKDS